MKTSRHIIWILLGGIVGFLASFLFGDLFSLPLDLYYLIYFAIITLFLTVYIKRTQLDIKQWVSRRILWGILLGLLFSIIMIFNVLSRPETEKFSGGFLVWAVFWRGLIYGAVDGLLLTVFPWIVTWRAFNVRESSLVEKIAFGFLTWIFIIFITSAYHLGYSDFRSKKVFQANIGNTIMSIPTLVSTNPVASPITHVALHVASVIHSPKTKLFLPPHRE